MSPRYLDQTKARWGVGRCVAVALFVGVVSSLGAACQDARESGVRGIVPLTTPTAAAHPVVPLGALPLVDQAGLDRFEEAVLGRRRVGVVVDLYERLSEGARPGDQPADALLLQRLALLLIDARGGSSQLSRGLELARRLAMEAPRSPHALYLQGYIKRKLLASGVGARVPALSAAGVPAAEGVIEDWSALLAQAPDYVGPDGHDAGEIREDLDRLRRAVEEQRRVKPVPTVEEPPPARVAGELEAASVEDLRALEDARDTERLMVCRDRSARERTGGASAPEARVDLRCATVLGELDLGMDALERLVASSPGRADDPCRWVVRLAAMAPAARKDALAAHVEALGLSACAER